MTGVNSGKPVVGTYDLLLKTLLIGDSGVGKSAILLRFMEGHFDDKQAATIGVDFKMKFLDVGNKRIKLFVWDTAGQERFRTLTSSYYRGAQGVALVYSCTSRTSFEALPYWLREIQKHCNKPGVVKLLVANKIDSPERVVTRQEGEQFALENSMLFIETSAKTSEGIKQAFEELIYKILDDPQLCKTTDGGNVRQFRTFVDSDDPEVAASTGCAC